MLRSIIILFILSQTSIGIADSLKKYQELVQLTNETKHSILYQASYEMCSQYSTVTVLKATWVSIKNIIGIPLQLDVEAAILLVQNKGISPHLAELLRSQAYYDAIEKCYGDANSDSAARFTMSLILADVSGALLGSVSAFYLSKMILRILFFAKTKSAKLFYSIVTANLPAMVYESSQLWIKYTKKSEELQKIKETNAFAENELNKANRARNGTLNFFKNMLKNPDLTVDEKTLIQQQILDIEKS